jgi:hypothetical protein
VTEKIYRKALLSLILSFYILCPTIVAPFSYTAAVNVTVKRVHYLHRTDLTDVVPAGKLMNTTRPPSSQVETVYNIARGTSIYFYTPPLSNESIQSGTWTLYIWASTARIGRVSRLTVRIHIVSSDGSIVKATIGTVTDIIIDYGYSERNITIFGSAATVASGDRIRLTLRAQPGAANDARGMNFYYDGYGTYQTLNHETRLLSP